MNLKGIFSRRSGSSQVPAPHASQIPAPRASQDPVSGSSTAALVPAASAPSASNSFAPTSTSAQLEIKNLRVRYPGRDVDAVANVSLNLAPGQTLALLGDSGSGKSTLLRAVGGLVDVSGGDICYAGESVLQVPVHQRGFVLMFQDGQLFNNLSVAENVAYGVGRHSEKVVAQMLELVGMSAYANSPVTELSGGQAPRAAHLAAAGADWEPGRAPGPHAGLELPLKLEYGQILAPAPGAWSLAPADASLGDGVAQAGVESVTMSQGSYLVQASLEAAAADPLTLRTSEPLEVEQWINVRLDLSRCPLIDMRKRA